MYETQRPKDQEQPSTDSKAYSGLTFPLSTAQSGMWFMQKLISPDSTFNIAEAIEIHGPIDPVLFEAALRQTAMEAESVRVRLIETQDGPKLTIAPSFDGQIPFFDVSAESDPREAAWRWMKAECAKPVDLLVGPLWVSALFKLTPEHFIWYHCCHHIILDGFSGGLMTRRVASLYNALVEKRSASDDDAFGSLKILFEEEKAYRSSTRFTRDREYWMQRFADRPKPVSLATRHSPNVGSPLRQTIHLSADSAGLLRRFARASGVSLPQLMIASIAAYLYRITGTEDLVVGMTVTGRANSRVRRVPGMMANVLPLRLAMTPNLSVAELLGQVSKEVRQVLRHQSYRYEDLRRDLHLMVAQSQHLFSTVINIEPFDYDLRFAGHPVTPHNLSNASAENLAVFVYDRGDDQGLCIDFDANSALYCIEELAEHQERLVKFIESMICDADQPISHIDILTPAERQRLLIGWNATKVDYPQYCCIHQLFEAQVRNTPDAVAVVFEDRQLTYAELNSRANRLAHHLRSLGVKPEARVAICLERSFEMVVGLLAVLKAGGAYVPLDPSYPEDRLAYMLTDSAPQALLTLGNLAANFLAAAPEVPVVDLAEAGQWAHQSVENPDPAAVGLTPRHLAYVIYTSGSTGQPKGAMNEHRGVVNRLIWKQNAYKLTAQDTVLQKTPFSFDVSVWEFFWPLLTGARLVMARPGGHKDPSYLVDVIRQNNITTLHFVPSMLQVFLEHSEASTCSSLVRVMCSGEALPEPFARRFHERLPHAGLHNLYGPTEAAVDVTAWAYTPDFSGTSIPLGRPIANTQIYILDERGEPTPTGVEGEIFIGGVQVGRGYLDRPDLTAERFVPDPFGKPGARLYRTGDLGRWQADGTLEYLGRNDFQVKIRGFRIELGEIEAQLASHPDVREAAVVTRESPTGDPRLIAYYSAETTLAAMSLRSYLGERLPDYMVPAVFVWLETFPLSPNGKLDRKALPVDIGLRQDRVAIAPRNQHELQITQIWQSIFGQDDLSIDDNFFELGGHSLQAVQMIAKIEAELGKQLPLVSLFKAPTIEQLARLVSDDPTEEIWEPVVKLYAGGSGSPVFCVPGVGGQCHSLYHLAVALGRERPVYAFQPYGLDGCSEPHATIEAMAAYYLDLMLEIQPIGPYHLVGHSFGGCVAFEMAKRLEEAGREVGFVALLDSGIPSGSDATDAALNVQSLKALAYVYGREITIDAEALEGLAEEEQLKLIRPHLVELGVVREDAGLNMVRGLMNISKAQVRMSYQPDGVPVQQILFIQAEERRFDATIELLVLERAVAQWKRLSKRPFVHVHVPGDHFSMLDQKNAHKVAAILQSWMASEESDTIEPEELASEVA
jgi:amino acid adenylation domain-containing protein